MPTATKTKKAKAKAKKGKSSAQIYQEVTDRVISALEKGTVPWQRPWKVEGGLHKNLVSKKFYRGANILLLDITAMIEGYTSPYWVTYKQAQQLGGQVQGGEHGTKIVYFKLLPVGEEEFNPHTGRTERKVIPLLKQYTVFNIEQCEGIDPKKIPAIEKSLNFSPDKRAEALLKGMPEPCSVWHGGDRAAYNPMTDKMRLPAKSQFNSVAEYYATRFHETIHSTGHSSRVGRPEVEKYEEGNASSFGDENYTKEELTAELGAGMLSALTGIETPEVRQNTESYIANWIQKLKEDPRFVVSAGSKAQAACDYLTGVQFEEKK